ncbi:YcaO-like family protein [Kribbella sindirgiensis]|uniref:YcaO-like family protein n=1 Tax=Kribbella sindirgiensis TaxID=1124744 RepID=UPI0013F4BC93|nr:YcaO-like family protein [Kribbella sindirgiensis]
MADTGDRGSHELFLSEALVPDEPSIPSPPDIDRGTGKAVMLGTHRVVTANATWRRARDVFSIVGISRVGDLTMLDEIGIPVWQAVRPNAATLSVSQGKGISHDLARVSAAMEAIELWHAEQARAPHVVDSITDLQPVLTYNVRTLHLAGGSLLTEALEIPWIEGEDVLTLSRTLVPLEYIVLNDEPSGDLSAPLFVQSSNGLASGNSVAEATLHGLLEVLERDLTATVGRSSPSYVGQVDLDSIEDGCSRVLVDLLLSADVHLRVTDCGTDGIACFSASIWSVDFPFVFDGFGCHFDRDVALARALTEAAQSRLTAVAGARDDLPFSVYRDVQLPNSAHPPWPPAPVRSDVRFTDIATTCRPGIEDDVRAAASLIAARTGQSPIVVDLTHPQVGIPVVRVVGPGLGMGRQRAA